MPVPTFLRLIYATLGRTPPRTLVEALMPSCGSSLCYSSWPPSGPSSGGTLCEWRTKWRRTQAGDGEMQLAGDWGLTKENS